MMMYAVKVIDKQAHKADILIRLRREIDLMEALDHPNIVKLHEVIETQFTIYVCMEYVEGCSLEEFLKTHEFGRISEKEARKITRELANAISHCHSRLVAHRDIKPANILITSTGKVMLIDFGLGNTFSPRARLNTICGSLPYYSPEIARGSSYMGPEVDIWCLGVVLYRMTVGRDPFIGSTKREVKMQITQGGFSSPSHLSQELRATLTKLLAPESSRRRSLTILENDVWLHMGDSSSIPPFLAEERSVTDASRLSGSTLVRHPSKATTTTGATAWKRLSMTDSYYNGKRRATGSLFGSRSLLADTIGAGVWQLDKDQPRFHKSRVRIIPCKDTADQDLLFQKDIELSLLQFLMPIIRMCHVSYYLHSTSRILCGTSFVKDSMSFAASLDQFHHQPSIVLQKIVQHLGAAMTGGSESSAFHRSSTPAPATRGNRGNDIQERNTRYGVFSIDIVKAKGRIGERGGYVLVIKRLFGSASTVQHFKKLFIQHAKTPSRDLDLN
ncbi:Serine/threonine-protein kinase par-1 [Linnemannia zychae]|nr:Serine/threonine-protein kinase par-1 [Linnemannia zychae]